MSDFDFTGIKVVVIDDQPVIRGMVRGLLKRLGVEQMWLAADGSEGLVYMAEHEPDCVLCDINMLPMNGLELVKLVRAGDVAKVRRDLPIAMLTGHSDAAIVGTALALDVSAFILKPVSGAQLGARVARSISQPPPVRDAAHYGAIDLPDLAVTLPSVAVRSSPAIMMAEIEASNEGIVLMELEEVPTNAVLGRDIYSATGQLLLAKGRPLNRSMLDRLSDLLDVNESLRQIWVRR